MSNKITNVAEVFFVNAKLSTGALPSNFKHTFCIQKYGKTFFDNLFT